MFIDANDKLKLIGHQTDPLPQLELYNLRTRPACAPASCGSLVLLLLVVLFLGHNLYRIQFLGYQLRVHARKLFSDNSLEC